jgi:HEPN domain-containing protein
MRDPKQAKTLLAMAHKDLRALQAMMSPEVFAEEIFGFHCQQCVEKVFKAWLAALGVEYPLTHDLSVLLGRLEELGHDMEPYWDLVEFNAFAVRFRYESFEGQDEPVDRKAAVLAIECLVNHVQDMFSQVVSRE